MACCGVPPTPRVHLTALAQRVLVARAPSGSGLSPPRRLGREDAGLVLAGVPLARVSPSSVLEVCG